MLILQAYDQPLRAVRSASSLAFRSVQVKFLVRQTFRQMSASVERITLSTGQPLNVKTSRLVSNFNKRLEV